MAVTRKVSKPPQLVETAGTESNELGKIARLLGLLVVKGESQPEKIRLLASASFTNSEIAEMLGVTANAVNVALHRIRKKP